MEQRRWVWTAKELIKHGFSRRKVGGMMRKGTLFRVLRGVYSRDKPSGDVVWQAVLLVRPNAVLDGKSAVEVYQGRELSLPLRVRVDTSNVLVASRDAVVATRSQRMRSVRRRGYRVVPVVDAVATCVDEGSVSASELRKLVEEQYRSGQGVKQLKVDVKGLGTRRKAGLLEFLESCIHGTDSGLERKLVAELRDAGFRTRQNVTVGGYRWDIEVVGVALIDVDSRKYHQAHDRNFIIDRWKTNEAVAQGSVPLRFSDDCVNYAMEDIIRLLRQVAAFRKKHPRRRVKVPGLGPVFRWHNALASPF